MNNFTISKFEYILGTVVDIIYKDSKNFYKVILVKIKNSNIGWKDNFIIVTGIFINLDKFIDYKFYGILMDHPKYGNQFKSYRYEIQIPTDANELINYLSSEHFPGIGKKTAERLINNLGNNVIQIIRKTPEKIKNIGLKSKQIISLINGVKSINYDGDLFIKLYEYGFSDNVCIKILNKYHSEALSIVNNNPYQLLLDIRELNFDILDEVAQKIGISYNSKIRIEGSIFQSLNSICYDKGYTYVTDFQLLNYASNLLKRDYSVKIDSSKIFSELKDLSINKKLIFENNKVYLKKFYDAEHEIANKIYNILHLTKKKKYSNSLLNKLLIDIENSMNIRFDETQRDAIFYAINSQFFILTGGPGTGKTTIIRAIIELFIKLNDIDDRSSIKQSIILAAPTGKAAERMSRITHFHANTIHRILGLNEYDNLEDHLENLDCKLLIIDETSMIDTMLMNILLKSIPLDTQIIFIGDTNQLPSVGPGQILCDLMNCTFIPKKKLNNVYRQSQTSSIIELSYSIKDGILPDNFTESFDDRSFISCHSNQIPNIISQIVKIWINKGNDINDFQILSPMYKGPSGIDNLNKTIQSIINPNNKEVIIGSQKFKVGDRVLQLVNSPNKKIFNGDIGTIVNIKNNNPANIITVKYNNYNVTYDKKELDQITLAYCISIHKSQGCEFPLVILPMVSQFSRMFARNLLYTAISRAQNKLILLGELNAFNECIKIISSKRQTSLNLILDNLFKNQEGKNALNYQKFILTNEIIENKKIDPLIGIGEYSPWDFM